LPACYQVGEDDGAHDPAVRLSGRAVNKLNVEPKMAALSLSFGKLCSRDDVKRRKDLGVGGSQDSERGAKKFHRRITTRFLHLHFHSDAKSKDSHHGANGCLPSAPANILRDGSLSSDHRARLRHPTTATRPHTPPSRRPHL